jgi:DNA-binding beta-propeller fold protein YncE
MAMCSLTFSLPEDRWVRGKLCARVVWLALNRACPAPGGQLVDTDSSKQSEMCIFSAKSAQDVRAVVEVINKVNRRYKYLAKQFEEECKKVCD